MPTTEESKIQKTIQKLQATRKTIDVKHDPVLKFANKFQQRVNKEKPTKGNKNQTQSSGRSCR